MPGIMAELGEFDRYAWPTVSYLVASAVAMPVAGRFCDLFGVRTVLSWGLVLLMLGSLVVSFADSMTLLTVLRIGEGLGAGLLLASCYVSAVDLYAPKDRGMFQGLIGVVYGAALLVGPIAGGLIETQLGWEWIFRCGIPVGIVAVILARRYYPVVARDRTDGGVDVPGMILLPLVAVPLLVALSMGGVALAWTSWPVIALIAVSLITVVVFIWIELRTASPIMPMNIYRDRTMVIAAIATTLSGFALYGSPFFLPLYFQGVSGLSSTLSGVFVGIMMLAFVFGAVVVGILLSRLGTSYRLLVQCSAAFMFIGILLLATLSTETPLVLASLYALIAGLGLGGLIAVFTVVVQNTTSLNVVGSATAALQFFRLLGGLIGLSILGVVVTQSFENRALQEAAALEQVSVSPEVLATFAADPTTLVDPSRREEVRQTTLQAVGTEALVDSLFAVLAKAMVGALRDLFLTCFAVVALCFLICQFFREPKLSSED